MLRHLLAFGSVSVLLVVGCFGWTPNTLARASAQPQARPGWPKIFVPIPMYAVSYETPVVRKGQPQIYSQKAIYLWTGGRAEKLEITVARDPAFKDRYSAKALRAEKNAPRQLEINKKVAWEWTYPRVAGKLDALVRRLVVLLDTDKALVIEQLGGGPGLERVASQFDFPAIAKALANPPKE
jgi:hypothetical protein